MIILMVVYIQIKIRKMKYPFLKALFSLWTADKKTCINKYTLKTWVKCENIII